MINGAAQFSGDTGGRRKTMKRKAKKAATKPMPMMKGKKGAMPMKMAAKAAPKMAKRGGGRKMPDMADDDFGVR